MKVRIRLGEEDRARFECPEWMEVDVHSVRASEAFVMQAGLTHGGVTVGFDSPNDWRAALNKNSAAAFILLVWLALHRHGNGVPVGDLEFDFDTAQAEAVADPVVPDAESGKGEDSDPGTT